jgi:hypothetical protein
MKPYLVLLPVLAFATLALGVRWQFNGVMREATSEGSNPFPVSTPFQSSLCGSNGELCKNLDNDWYIDR